MSDQELSFQQLDPVGSYGARPVTLVASAGILILALVATIVNWVAVTNPVAAVLAVVATALCVAGLDVWSSPLRAPFTRGRFVVVGILAASAIGLSSAATWESPPQTFGQWAPIAFGLTIALLAPYRPARELAGTTILGAIGAGFLTVLHPTMGVSASPALVAVTGSAIPLLALGLGGSAYASALARSLGRWHSRALLRDRTVSDELRERIIRSVQHDRVTILNTTVVPFFTELLERDALTDDDRERAVGIAGSIRAIMVADVDRSWLDAVVDQVASELGDGASPGSEVVQDHERLASGMTPEQRTVTRALVIALFDHPGFDADGFAVLIAREGTSSVVTLTAKLDADDSIPRSGLAGYFAVLRIAFGDLQLTFQRPTLTLRFSYDQT